MNIVPSIELIPAKYGVGTLLTQVPMDVSGDFSVTRATAVATRYNSAGLIETIPSGIPRLDYYTSSGTPGCPALLVEPAATNFARNVQFMTQVDTPAASGGLTITTGSTDFLAPDGTSGSITKYVGGAASGISQFAYDGSAYTVTSAGQHTFSLFVKAGSSNPANFIRLRFAGWTSASGTSDTFFSLASGTALTVGASIQDYGNGWYRLISAPYTIASGDLQGLVTVSLAEAPGDVTWPVSGALNLTAYTWGVQLEAGSVPTSYVPTTTGSVTRDADVINKTSVSGLIGQTEGTIYAEVDIRNFAAAGIFLSISDATSSNRVQLYKFTDSKIYADRISATQSALTSISTSALSIGIYKVAFAYSSGNSALFINGQQIGSNATQTFTFGAMGKISLGARFDDTQIINDRIRSAAIYATRLPNYLLESATSQIQSYSALASSLSYTVV